MMKRKYYRTLGYIVTVSYIFLPCTLATSYKNLNTSFLFLGKWLLFKTLAFISSDLTFKLCGSKTDKNTYIQKDTFYGSYVVNHNKIISC